MGATMQLSWHGGNMSNSMIASMRLLVAYPAIASSFMIQGSGMRPTRSTDQRLSSVRMSPGIVEENTSMHSAAIRESEETFYGFYPGGFTEFNLEQSPSTWISYVAATSDEVATETGSSTDMNVWDTFLQLDERTIPPPFQATDLARVSRTPVVTEEECRAIVSECESHYWGWNASRERYGTPAHRIGRMLKLEDLSHTYTFVNFELLPRLFPAIAMAFPDVIAAPENLRLGGCRVVKYDAAEGSVELGLHRDGLLVTANIALNDSDAYEEGGTIIEGLSEAIRLPMGHVLLHPGDVKHGGKPITNGVRYVMVCFVFDTTIVPHEKYCQDRILKYLDAARLIPGDDKLRTKEREDLLARASKHCADAHAFGKL